jgi:predicted DNA-binding transcriptional regulator AlpA
MRRRPTTRAETGAPPEVPLLLKPEEAFASVQVGRTRGWRMIHDGTLPSVRLSPRIVRVPRQALEALIAAGGVQGTTDAPPEPVDVERRHVVAVQEAGEER